MSSAANVTVTIRLLLFIICIMNGELGHRYRIMRRCVWHIRWILPVS